MIIKCYVNLFWALHIECLWSHSYGSTRLCWVLFTFRLLYFFNFCHHSQVKLLGWLGIPRSTHVWYETIIWYVSGQSCAKVLCQIVIVTKVTVKPLRFLLSLRVIRLFTQFLSSSLCSLHGALPQNLFLKLVCSGCYLLLVCVHHHHCSSEFEYCKRRNSPACNLPARTLLVSPWYFCSPLHPPHPSNAPEISFAYAKSKTMNIQKTLCQLQTTSQRQHSLSSPTALSCAPLNWSQILTPWTEVLSWFLTGFCYPKIFCFELQLVIFMTNCIFIIVFTNFILSSANMCPNTRTI